MRFLNGCFHRRDSMKTSVILTFVWFITSVVKPRAQRTEHGATPLPKEIDYRSFRSTSMSAFVCAVVMALMTRANRLTIDEAGCVT